MKYSQQGGQQFSFAFLPLVTVRGSFFLMVFVNATEETKMKSLPKQ